MLYRLVRPVKRPGSTIPQFVQRIPADVRAHAIGVSLAIPALRSAALIVVISAR